MLRRLVVNLKGAIQGVGMRPFVYRIAKELGLKGYVLNNSSGVTIEIEGDKDILDKFLLKLHRDKPPLAHIFSQELNYKEPCGYKDFEIRQSTDEGRIEVAVIPDIAICELCLKELLDLKDRRYAYPFINCTNCGPRFTIIENLPYDRPNTTMKVFMMCPECEREYEGPADRRFHAQPNACRICGPHVSLYRNDGTLLAERGDAIYTLIRGIEDGSIVAVRGIGGFHLICDARDEGTVSLLRERKRRQEKPFAVMFPDIESVKRYADISILEEAFLLSPERPIVLIKRKDSSGGFCKGDFVPLASSVAPGLKRIGAFLPYSPLHHIILKSLSFPVVATSGNFSDEPIVKDNDEALRRLSAFVDLILLHNRPIHRRCDDSVAKVIGGFPTLIRRSRGYAPMPVRLPFGLRKNVLAVGGFLKNTFAIGFDDKVIVSQHIGDIETVDTINYFGEAVRDFCKLYNFKPHTVVYDLHPGYETTRWALSQEGMERLGIQHHFAHILSCMAENGIGLEEEVLGVAWDGTGYGDDRTLWGGEFMVCGYKGYRRVAYLRPFRLLGGEKAIKEPRRVALSILFELFGENALDMDVPTLRSFNKQELYLLFRAWQKGINSPLSTSTGRLFDAVASLLDIRQFLDYEGQAAMMIEDLYDENIKDPYPYEIKDGLIEWRLMFQAILTERERQKIPSRFINTLSEIILQVSKTQGIEKICLSGGVFQNDPLTARVKELLCKDFEVFTQKNVPPNDGGISLGQAVYGGLHCE